MARSDWGIGIVGLGNIANTHIQAYRNAGLKVIGGADIDEQRAKATQERWQLPFVTTDWHELIDHPEVRIVDIAAPHKFEIRIPIVEYAAKKGKAIFIQKPLLPYLDQARKLVEVAERYGAPLMVNQNSVFVPAFLEIERYLRNGTIGTPYYCQIENRNWFDLRAHPWYGKDDDGLQVTWLFTISLSFIIGSVNGKAFTLSWGATHRKLELKVTTGMSC